MYLIAAVATVLLAYLHHDTIHLVVRETFSLLHRFV